MTRIISARQGRVLHVTETGYTIQYTDVLHGGPLRIVTVHKSAVNEPLQRADVVVWEVTTAGLHKIMKYREPQTMPTVIPDNRPEFLHSMFEEKATLPRRYAPLVHPDAQKHNRPRGACLMLFIHDLVDAYVGLGCTVPQAQILTAYALLSCNAGAHAYNHNYGRVVARPSTVKGRYWFRMAGDTFVGEPPILYMVSFSSLGDYAQYSLNTFAPKPEGKEAATWPDAPQTDNDFRSAGLYFWGARGRDMNLWYGHMILAGKEGSEPKINTEKRQTLITVYRHALATVMAGWQTPFSDVKHMQSALTCIARKDAAGMVVPYYQGAIHGNLDVATKLAIREFQQAAGLPQTGAYTSGLGRTVLRTINDIYPH